MNRFVFLVPPGVGTNVNLTSLHGDGLLLGTTNAPAGSVTGIILNISGAEAFWTDDNSSRLKVVANGKLMAPVHFVVLANGSTDLTIDVLPGDLHVSQGNMKVLSPVIHVTVVTHTSTSSSQTSVATQTTSIVTNSTAIGSTNSTSTTATTVSTESTTTTST